MNEIERNIIEKTVLTIESGLVAFYIDYTNDEGVELWRICQDEKYLKQYDNYGQGMEYLITKLLPGKTYQIRKP